MKLRRLRIDRLPGIEASFTLEPGDGVNLLVGPNASGKSSVARAVRSLLWPGTKATGPFLVGARFEAGGELDAEAVGSSVTWKRDGAAVNAPALPGDLLAGCYALTVSDLLQTGGAVTGDLARDIRREMAGGFDLDTVRSDIGDNQPTQRKATDLRKSCDAAEALVREVKQGQDALAAERDDLQDLQAKAAAAEGARLRADALEAMKTAAEARRRLAAAQGACARFDAAVAQVRPTDADEFMKLRERLAQVTARRRQAESETARLGRLIRECQAPADSVMTAELERLAKLVAVVREADAVRREAAAARGERGHLLAAAEAAATTPDHPGNTLDRLLKLAAERAGDAAAATTMKELPHKASSRGVAPTGIAAALLVAVAVAPLDLPPALRLVLGAAGLAAGMFAARMAVRAAQWRTAADLAGRLDDAAAPARDLARQARQAAEDLARKEADLSTAEAALADALQAMTSALKPWGEPAPTTLAEAEAAEAAARAKAAEQRTRRKDLVAAETVVHDAAEEMDRAAAAAAAILERLDLPADTIEAAPIRALADQHQAWQAARQALAKAEATAETAADDAARKAAAAGLAGDGTVPADVDEQIAEQRTIAAEAKDHAEAVGDLKRRLAIAEDGHALAEARARLALAEDAVAEWLDQALDDAGEAALLDELQAAHDSTAAPPRLTEANRLLADFTHGRYELRVGGAAAAFVVRDHAEGTHLDLAEVSDGTRTQILLALRVAYIAALEGGVRLPLFLDEALTTTDPVRLQAVVRSLGLLARDHGRQVFYLTSQGADVAAWTAALEDAGLPAPTVLDLAQARALAQAAPAVALQVPSPASVPAPGGMDAEAYGRLLKVPALDPHRPWENVPVFYLVGDDLDLAHALYRSETRSAGVLAGALDALESNGSVTPMQAADLRLALQVLQSFWVLWSVGRPAPAPWEEIIASGAVSETFLAPMHELHRRCRGDARAIIDGIAQKAVPGFLTKKRDDLAQHFEERNYLDARDPLPDDEILRRVLLQTSSQAEARTAPEAVRAHVTRLLGALGAGAAD